MLTRFNERANSYSQAAVVQQHLATWLAQWLEPIEKTLSLSALEFGPADGLFTKFLAPRFDHLTAVDLAPCMVERGRKRFSNVEWQVGDGWQFAGMSVNRLYSASLLQWCTDPVHVLKRWRLLAKQGARMLHGFYVAPTLAEWQKISPTRSPISWRSSAEWLDCFREAGWSVLRSETKTHRQQFPSALELFRFFQQTGATTPTQVPVGRLKQMIAEYGKQFTATDGSADVTSTWTLFRVEVQR